MFTEDYVSFETAKLLKEKGFNWEWSPFYSEQDRDEWVRNNNYNIPNPNYDANIPFDSEILNVIAPHVSLQMAMKWLRKAHKCIITCYWEFENYVDDKPDFSSNIVWSYNIAIAKYNSARKGNGDYFDMYSEKEDYPSYEEACEAAIVYFLTNLI